MSTVFAAIMGLGILALAISGVWAGILRGRGINRPDRRLSFLLIVILVATVLAIVGVLGLVFG